MYRVLVVDDDTLVADGLKEILSALNDVELDVYTAYSANKALDFFSRNRVDILLSDIKMPGMDGMQLLSIIKEKWPMCSVIMLTGQPEFEYLYQTMQYENVRFLLKTEGYSKIMSTVRSAIDSIESQLKTFEHDIATDAYKSYRFAYLDSFGETLLTGNQTLANTGNDLKALDIPLTCDRPVLLLLGRPADSKSSSGFVERQLWKNSLRDRADKFLDQWNHVCFVNDGNIFTWLFQIDHDVPFFVENVQGCVELMQELFTTQVGTSFSFLLVDAPIEWDELSSKWLSAYTYLSQNIKNNSDMFVTMNAQERERDEEPLFGIRRCSDALSNALLSGNKEQYDTVVFPWYEEILKSGVRDSLSAQAIYISIATPLFLHVINNTDIAQDVINSETLRLLTNPTLHRSWDASVSFLKQFASLLFNEDEYEKQQKTEDTIEKIKRHIHENVYNPDETSLVRLAEIAYYSPSYLSRVFKKETHTTLSSYIAQIRIRKAKDLLSDKSIKIQDVAVRSGYPDTHNFSRFFKKETGMSPQQYRDTTMK